MRSADAGLRLEIADNGAGFELTEVNGGYGLHTMRERAAELGGNCTSVRSARG